MTDWPTLTRNEARGLTIDATLHEHRGALRALLARAFDGGYAAGELAAQARVRALEAETARLRAAFLRYCAGDPPHAVDCPVYDGYQHGPCECGVEALLAEPQARAARAGEETP